MLDSVKETAANNKKRNKRLLARLKTKPDKWLDIVFQESHEYAFNKIDCLECANCCKTTGPLFTKSDIQRISKHFSLKTSEFISMYLLLDEDGDYVLQKVRNNNEIRLIYIGYMACYLPVICSDIDAMALIVREENCGYVFKDRDIEQFAHYVYTLSDSILCEYFGDCGQKAVKEKYNWDIERRKILEKIDNVA